MAGEYAARVLEDYFDAHPTFEMEKLVGSGSSGLAVLVRYKNNDNGDNLRCIVKRSLAPEISAEEIREIEVLQILRGAAHIVQLLAFNNDSGRIDKPTFWTLLFKWINPPPEPNWSSIGPGLPGPTIVMEFCENGDVHRILERAHEARVQLPNRMLWSFFLCLLRAVVAMAYPPSRTSATRQKFQRLETVPPLESPGLLTHNDIHSMNVMIHDEDHFPEEHIWIPSLILIDFGKAEDAHPASHHPRDQSIGVETNLLDMAKVVYQMITGDQIGYNLYYEPRSNFSPPLSWPGRTIETYAVKLFPPASASPVETYPDLDPDLRMLLARCLAVDKMQRPDFPVVLATVERAACDRDALYYSAAPYADRESDDAIKDMVQHLIHNSDDHGMRIRMADTVDSSTATSRKVDQGR